MNVTDRMLRGVLEATHNEHDRTRIGAQLELAGVALDELRAASAHDRRVPNISFFDFVQSISLPGMHELRMTWSLILNSLFELRALVCEANRRPVMSAVLGVTLLVARDRRIRMACAALSVGLFALGKPYSFYSSPNISHFIIVVDLFDKEVQIPLSEAASSVVRQPIFVLALVTKLNQTLHGALSRHFAGKIVLVLLQQRQYELQVTEGIPGSMIRHGQALPQRWINMLHPGSRLRMNALFSGVSRDDSSRIICPACSSSFPPEDSQSHSGWVQW